jgi:hypothetical protein
MFLKRSVNGLVLTWLLIAVVCLLLAAQGARAADITVCRRTDVGWLSYQFDGVDFSADTFGYVALGASQIDDDTLIADALLADNGDGHVLAGEAYIAYHIGDGVWFELWGRPETKPCGEDEEGWQPGAPSIDIPLTADCSFVEIQDPNGNWHPVTVNGEPVLLHYGESLIGGDQSSDPADYQAVPTACY